MRGFLQPALKSTRTENQIGFSALSRARRTKLATTAGTDLLKASQWARGEEIPAEHASALDKGVAALLAKKK